MRRHNALSAAALAMAALAASAPLAKAAQKVTVSGTSGTGAECGSQVLTQAFLPFGDANLYGLIPQGSFEGTTSGWIITGSGKVVADPAYPGGPTADTVSLELAPGAKATSPPVCANRQTPLLRFFQKAMSPNPNVYSVDFSYLTATGGTTFGGQVSSPTTSWKLTPGVYLNTTKIPVNATSGWGYVRVSITAPTNSALRVDDIYLDPRMR
jgi:hypothetical protein